MNQDDLVKLISELRAYSRETEWLEFKVNNYTPNDIGEYVSAIANSALLDHKREGYLVFGIDDSTHQIVGTTFTPFKNKIGNEEFQNWIVHNLTPRLEIKIHEIEFPEGKIVVLVIPSTTTMPVRFLGTEYIRIGSYKKKLSDYPNKAKELWLYCSGYSYETDISYRNISDDKVLELIYYPSFFELMSLPLPTNKHGILQKLTEEKLITMERGYYNITNLGALLFAKDLSKFNNLSRKSIRVIQYNGIDRVKAKNERLGKLGYASGFQGLINYINQLLPSNEEIGKALRREVKMYPEIAIREIVANALIHQDLAETGTGPIIEIFQDRIEITNPGKPIINPLRFLDHPPQSRNEKLAYFMRRLKICEERGSGIDKVIFNTELYQLPAPQFIEGDNFLKVILYSYKTLRQMDKEDKIRACYQHCCLKYVSEGYMTNQTLRHRFAIEEKNYSIVSRIIAETIEANLIKYEDETNKSKKYTKYVPIWA